MFLMQIKDRLFTVPIFDALFSFSVMTNNKSVTIFFFFPLRSYHLMTYFGIDSAVFSGIPSIPALLSVSEMLENMSPSISGALVRYAQALIQNSIAQAGSSPVLDDGLNKVTSIGARLPCASAPDLERFADSVMASAAGDREMMEVSYLCYSSISLHFELSGRVLKKLANAEHGLQLA